MSSVFPAFLCVTLFLCVLCSEILRLINFFVKYLYDYAHTCTCLSEQYGKVWAEQQKTLLSESEWNEIIESLQTVSRDKSSCAAIINYSMENRDRIDYQKAGQTGAGLIGSGAVEAARRTVIQSRLKLSGQPWTKSGTQDILNLRVTEINQPGSQWLCG